MSNPADHLKLLSGIVAISFSPLAVKAVSLSTTVSAFYRSFYAACFFLILALFTGKLRDIRELRWFLPSLVAGLFLGIDLAVWHKTIVILGAGPATFLGNSQILFMALFSALVFREKIPRMYYVTVILVIAGLFLLTPPSPAGGSRLAGYAMGLVVGFTYAGMLIGLRYAKELSGQSYPELLSLCVVFSFSSLVIGLYDAAAEGARLLAGDLKSHLIMMITAFMCQTFGWYLINTTITRIPAHEGSLLLMLQPLLATTWGSLFFAEPLGAVQVFGIVLTLSGIFAYQFRYASKKAEARLGFEE